MATTTAALADLLPGDRIVRYRDHRTGTWHTPTRPLLVTGRLAPVWDGGPAGVRMHSTTAVEVVLYPDFVESAEVIRSRGYGTRTHATAAARKAAGWSVRGGYYYKPSAAESDGSQYVEYVYAGFQGADAAAAAFARRGWIVALDGRWYVTDGPGRWAAAAAARLRVTPAYLAVAAANANRGSVTRRPQYVGA